MRILYLTHNYPRFKGDHSGAFIQQLIRALPSSVEPYILCPHQKGLSRKEERGNAVIYRFTYAGDEAETLAYHGKMLDTLKQGLKGFALLERFISRSASHARRIVEAEEIDLVHAHWLVPAGLAARFALAGIRIPLLVSLHGTDVRLLSRLPLGRLAADFILSKVDLALPVSRYLGTRLKKITGTNIKCITLPMPASGMFLSSPRRVLKRALIGIGNLTRQKRFDILIRAVGILRKEGLSLELTLVGDGVEKARLRSLVAELGLAGSVIFTGSLPHHHLPGVLRDAGVMVLPSVAEGFGMVLVEAQLAGLVAIGADAGGQREIINHGETGILVRPDDPRALASAIRDLYNNEEKSLRLAQAGQQAARRFLALPGAERLVNIYSSILHR